MNDPAKILAPYVREGMTILEPGPAMGFFTLELARRVGPKGRVVAVDVQPKLLKVLERRARNAGLADRLDIRLAEPDSMRLDDLTGQTDFALAFAVVHEMPSAESFFVEASRALKPGALMLFAEPTGHVEDVEFEAEVEAASRAGLRIKERPPVRGNHSALLEKV
jgi:ubiquinone/menaquinone biosynthesis C-methylase UbiE